MNKIVKDICVKIFLWTNLFISLGKYLGVELVDCTVSMFLRNCQLLSKMTALFYIPGSMCEGSHF